jgi:hypothetical protein
LMVGGGWFIDCLPSFPCAAFEKADAVALVRAVETVAEENNESVYAVEVKELFKGEMETRTVVNTMGGVSTLRAGEIYVLHLSAFGGRKRHILTPCDRVWSWRSGMMGELVYLSIVQMRARARDLLTWLTWWMAEHVVGRWMCIGLPLFEGMIARR